MVGERFGASVAKLLTRNCILTTCQPKNTDRPYAFVARMKVHETLHLVGLPFPRCFNIRSALVHWGQTYSQVFHCG
jgi:hypothetical protein